MKYYFNKINNYTNPVPLYFLCGVQYNEKNPQDDKRIVLKKFLKDRKCFSLILEEHFILGCSNSSKLGYRSIEINNLNDIEVLACIITDGIFIIHESQSTAAEIALFTSNDCVAEKVFILVPDEGNVRTNHFGGFLKYAYESLIGKCTTFYPVVEKSIVSEDKVNILTYFNNNEIGQNLGKKIEKWLSYTSENTCLDIIKSDFNKNRTQSNSYYIDGNKNIYFSIDIQILRYYLISLFNIPDFRKELRRSKSFYDGLTVCENWLKKIFINTVQKDTSFEIQKSKCNFKILNLVNGRLDLRKAISFILYIFHAMNWITIKTKNEGISITKGFNTIYEKYENIIATYNQYKIEGMP